MPARTDCAEAGTVIAISETAATKYKRFIAYAPLGKAYPTETVAGASLANLNQILEALVSLRSLN